MLNVLLTSAGRRTYMVEYFRQALAGRGEVHVTNSTLCQAFSATNHWAISPIIYSDDFIPFLLDYCRKHCIGLVVPLLDIDVPVLSRHKALFDEIGTTVVVPDCSIAEICNDKWKTSTFLTKEGLSVPQTALGLRDAMKQLECDVLHYPLIVKPRWGMASLGIQVVADEKELSAAVTLSAAKVRNSYLRYESARDSENTIIVQQFLEGDEYGLDIMSDLESRFISASVKEKQGMRSGETDVAMTVHDPGLETLSKVLAETLPHPGNLDVDVIVADGKASVLDLNARFGGGYPFSHVAGVNLPLALVEWKLGNHVDASLLTPRWGVVAEKSIVLHVRDEKGIRGQQKV